MNNFTKLLMEIEDRNSKIVVVEGFEMVGKTTLAKRLANEAKVSGSKFLMTYHANWEKVFSDNILNRGDRFLVGLAVVDSFLKCGVIDQYNCLLLDRWISSSYVYQEIYEQDCTYTDFEQVLEAHKEILGKTEILILHKIHTAKQYAKEWYLKATKNGNEHTDMYDKFPSFQQYWNTYIEFEKEFDNFYKKIMKNYLPGAEVLYVNSGGVIVENI